MKSLAEQSVSELGGVGSVLSRQKRDHVKLDQLLHQLDEAAPSGQNAILLKIYRLVFPHAYAEETILWPVIRRVLPDGHELTLRVEVEHQEINELVTRLEATPADAADRPVLLQRLVQLLREDVRDEEDLLLPRLQTKLNRSHLRRLGLAWDAVRRLSPTRAHPIVSRRPPGNILSALPLAIVDRCRDGVDTLIARADPAPSPGLHALSSALKRASHAVERLPGLRLGEEPSTGRHDSGWRWTVPAVIAACTACGLLLTFRRRRMYG